jgi:integrase
MLDVLTLDNHHLSRTKTEPDQAALAPETGDGKHLDPDQICAIDCKHPATLVEAFIQAGIAPATRRAYRSDLDHFLAWGGAMPATDAQIAAYVAAHAATLKVATLTRRLAAISVAHEAQGYASPVRSPLVRATMRGIRRERGVAQRQAKPLLREDLFAVLAAMGDGLKDARDRALLLIGFAGGFRRSELCAINCINLERVRQGLIVTLPRSKTDQDGEGRKIGIPFGRTKWCPVHALDHWLDRAGIVEGPIFRRVDRHGRVFAESLSPEAVCMIVRERVAAAGYDSRPFSGHSLRAGLATSAAQAGVPTWKIRAQTGHASDAMLARYVRDGEIFIDNAAGVLL